MLFSCDEPGVPGELAFVDMTESAPSQFSAGGTRPPAVLPAAGG